jgi:aminoglycoside phosphotransferase (APT) family kinase protein
VGSGATFLNALSEYGPDQAADSLEQLAQLHAHTWLNDVAGASWLDNRLSFYTVRRGVAEITKNFESTVGDGVPDAVRQPTQLLEAFKSTAELAASDTPWGVIHGDPHIGNLFLDSRRRPTFLDWQLVQRGPWYLDVGYHLASALDVEQRRQHEEDLVNHYLDRLAAGGVEPPTAGGAWERIIYGFVHGFYLWAITLRVDPAITSTLVRRLGTAVEDHAVFTRIKA